MPQLDADFFFPRSLHFRFEFAMDCRPHVIVHDSDRSSDFHCQQNWRRIEPYTLSVRSGHISDRSLHDCRSQHVAFSDARAVGLCNNLSTANNQSPRRVTSRLLHQSGQRSCRVVKFLHFQTRFLRHGQQHIRERGMIVLVKRQMLTMSQPQLASSGNNQRQILW